MRNTTCDLGDRRLLARNGDHRWVSAAEQRFGTGAWPWAMLITAAFRCLHQPCAGPLCGRPDTPHGPGFLAGRGRGPGIAAFSPGAILVLQRRVILHHWKLFLVMALAFMPMGNAVVYLGYNFTTAINGGIIAAAQPAMTVLFAWLILRHTINSKTGCRHCRRRRRRVGDHYPRRPPDLEPTVFQRRRSAAVTRHYLFFVLYGDVCAVSRRPSGRCSFSWSSRSSAPWTLAPFYLYESLIYLTVPVKYPVAAGHRLGRHGDRRRRGRFEQYVGVWPWGPAKASVAHYLRALFTAGMAILILRETMELFHLVSVALVIVGVVLMSRGKTPARRAETG